MKKTVIPKSLLLPSLIATLFGQVVIHPAYAACTASGNGLACSGTSNTVSGQTITLPTSGAANNGIDANSMGNNAASLIVTNTTINNQKNTAPSLGINFGTQGTSGSGNLSLTMSGTNSVTTNAGTSVLVNNLGTGSAKITILGDLAITNNSSNAGDHDGVEATSRQGVAEIDMSAATGTIRVMGGNGILINSINNGGGDVVGNIASGIVITMDNTSSTNFVNSGIKATTQGDGTVSLTTAATINTFGPKANGITAYSNRGVVTVDNSGSITTDGVNSYGINAYTSVTGAQSAGNVILKNSGNIITSASIGISAYSSGTAAGPTGTVEITNSGNITTSGNFSYGIEASTSSSGAGSASNISVFTTSGAISTNGDGANGINASTSSSGAGSAGDVFVSTTGGTISTNGDDANGISAISTAAMTASAGTVMVNNANSIDTSGDRSQGIYALSGNTVDVTNSGTILTRGINNSAGIYAESAGAGNVTVTSTNANITTIGVGTSNDGIIALAPNAASRIIFTSGMVLVGGDSTGLLANGDITAEVIVNDGTINALATQNRGAIEALATNSASVTLDAASQVYGGSGSGVAISGVTQTLTNAGMINALSDVAIIGDFNSTHVGSTFTLTNAGTIEGTVTATNAATTFNNNGMWHLRSFADTDGDGGRDTWDIAVSDFGTSATNVINNTGMLTLIRQNSVPTIFNATGAYLPQGNIFNTPASGGPVQGQILNVQTFNNSGTIDLTGGSNVAGNVLVISGAQQPGTDGGGVFVSNDGTVIMNTVLNEGNANSQSDVLVVDSTQVGTGATNLQVNQVGGLGALTQGNGILLVEVLNNNASDTNAFTQAGRIVGGAFEYRLHHGGLGNDATDGNWYLRSNRSDLISEPILPSPQPEYRPEVGAYLGNQIAAMTMFRHTLHDRLGEVDYLERQRSNNNERHTAGWARVVGHHTKSEAASGQLDLQTNMGVAQVGLELGDWTANDSRWLVGVMAGAGTAHTDSRSSDYRAEGNVNGYSLGMYGTWYQSAWDPQGLYLDAWLQHSWYNNNVKGEQLATEHYNSRAWSGSLEAGYAFELKRDEKKAYYLEPQAQIIYTDYTAKPHREVNSTLVRPDNAGGFITRLGARVYSRPVSMDKPRAQPFFEFNWWHSYDTNSMTFNNYSLSQNLPSNIYEFKLGAQAEIGRQWTMWGNVGMRLGEHNFRDLGALIGLKYSW